MLLPTLICIVIFATLSCVITNRTVASNETNENDKDILDFSSRHAVEDKDYDFDHHSPYHLDGLNSANDSDVFWEPEPLISEPLIEDISPNSSLFLKMKQRRNIQGKGFTRDTKVRLLQLHNVYRGNVTPPAGNMAFMEWDDELERLAQKWVDGCSFEHGMPENDYPETIGQNLYKGSDPSGDLALWMWYEEHKYYDLRKQHCAKGKQCGHYVQMAWAPSNRLGCAVKRCGAFSLMACHYSPQALKGVQIYTVAKPCSQCDAKSGAKCSKNLCITPQQCKRNPFICGFAKCDLKCQNCGILDEINCRCKCADGWDSTDCSSVCSNKHERCGKSPGWPTKSACSLNRHAVENTYCRKMCGKCTPFDENKSNFTCCDGSQCPDGYVLDPSDKHCRCNLLCPGPLCDYQEGAVLASTSDAAWLPVGHLLYLLVIIGLLL